MSKYEDALERARKKRESCLKANSPTAAEMIEEIFPELKESEDERIRKAISAAICGTTAETVLEANGVKLVDALAYLEKQKDAFENGRQLGIMQERARQELGWLDEKQKEQKPMEFPDVSSISEEQLKADYSEAFYKTIRHYIDRLIDFTELNVSADAEMIFHHLRLRLSKALEERFNDGFNEGISSIKPAEWSEDFEDNIRNLLHDKLTGHSEDGRMSWTTLIDDKTLKDIVSGIWFYVGKEVLKYPNKELSQQEWSDEDEKMREECINAIEYARCEQGEDGDLEHEPCILWLKSLRPGHHWKPSEEQMNALEAVVGMIHPLDKLYDAIFGLLKELKKS